MDAILARRPLKTRDAAWAQGAARRLAGRGVAPNTISLWSVGFAAAAAVDLVVTAHVMGGPRILGLIGAALFIQLRLVCNLLDGMVAIEGGRRTKSGEVFNDLPDRVADVLILVALGYAASGTAGLALGWLASVLAVMTAYVRMLGGAAGLPQRFTGPMAKQHRMAVTTVALLIAAGVEPLHFAAPVLLAALVIIVIGSVVTVWRRTAAIVRELEAQ